MMTRVGSPVSATYLPSQRNVLMPMNTGSPSTRFVEGPMMGQLYGGPFMGGRESQTLIPSATVLPMGAGRTSQTFISPTANRISRNIY